jgi:predicted RNA-binding Zn ribbon-like protein
MLSKISDLKLVGGCDVFDFINTLHETKGIKSDHLTTYDQMLRWSRKTAILSKSEVKLLEAYIELHPLKGTETLYKILGSREVLRALFQDISVKRTPDRRTLEHFNFLLAESFSRIQVSMQGMETDVNFSAGGVNLELPLWRIVKSAYDLLTTQDLKKIKQCGRCRRLFLDKTKNHTKRWCTMETCGSQDKAIRYYQRIKTRKKNT